MITPEYLQTMARYNRWQNNNLYTAAETLSDADRRLDRGAFFRSIHETLVHILWADEIWLSRFDVCEGPGGGIAQSTERYSAWTDLYEARKAMDTIVSDWAAEVKPAELEGDFTWFSGAMGREMTSPKWLIFTHIFNHATHHRGQVHAMLTAAGAKPHDTDLPFMPDSAP
ncbi:MAG: DinB family protein [Pseudomonadota bacterium]